MKIIFFDFNRIGKFWRIYFGLIYSKYGPISRGKVANDPISSYKHEPIIWHRSGYPRRQEFMAPVKRFGPFLERLGGFSNIWALFGMLGRFFELLGSFRNILGPTFDQDTWSPCVYLLGHRVVIVWDLIVIVSCFFWLDHAASAWPVTSDDVIIICVFRRLVNICPVHIESKFIFLFFISIKKVEKRFFKATANNWSSRTIFWTSQEITNNLLLMRFPN